MMLNDIFAGRRVPMDVFNPNDVPEYVEATKALSGILSELRTYGVPDEAILRLDAAQNHVKAVEGELMFCYAVRFGAQLQRELSEPMILGAVNSEFIGNSNHNQLTALSHWQCWYWARGGWEG